FAQDTIPPKVSAPAGLHIPPIQLARLPNGLTIRVVEMHEVPLVEVALIVKGGGRLDGDRPGIARFVASMMDEGAGDRDAFGIAAQAAYLGADLGTGVDWDDTYVTLNTPKRTLSDGLDLMADVALRPTFKTADVTRERDLRVAQIIQSRD